MSALRKTCVFTILASLLAMVSTPTVAKDDRDEGRSTRRSRIPAVYIDECGNCHAPYPASGLPATSWSGLMASLDRHFGSDATLAPAETAAVRDWLQANAGRRAANPAAPLRITRTAWFLSEHDEVPASTWRSQAVGSPANCGGCHLDADKGAFSEHDVRLPPASTSRLSPGAKR